jgi:peroxiredoxin
MLTAGPVGRSELREEEPHMRNVLTAGLVAGLTAMPLLPSVAEVSTGKEAPAFTLADADGKSHSLSDFKGKYVVLEWVNHGCPFVKKHYDSGNMQKLQKEFTEKGVVWLAICSSAKGKQGFAEPEQIKKMVEDKKAVHTAYLVDSDGRVGRAYGAKTTPHMFVVDPEGKLIYQGAIDSVRSADSADIPDATNYVMECLNSAMKGEPIANATTKPYGCSVKYAK